MDYPCTLPANTASMHACSMRHGAAQWQGATDGLRSCGLSRHCCLSLEPDDAWRVRRRAAAGARTQAWQGVVVQSDCCHPSNTHTHMHATLLLTAMARDMVEHVCATESWLTAKMRRWQLGCAAAALSASWRHGGAALLAQVELSSPLRQLMGRSQRFGSPSPTTMNLQCVGA